MIGLVDKRSQADRAKQRWTAPFRGGGNVGDQAGTHHAPMLISTPEAHSLVNCLRKTADT